MTTETITNPVTVTGKCNECNEWFKVPNDASYDPVLWGSYCPSCEAVLCTTRRGETIARLEAEIAAIKAQLEREGWGEYEELVRDFEEDEDGDGVLWEVGGDLAGIQLCQFTIDRLKAMPE